jgi:hypothetical protein
MAMGHEESDIRPLIVALTTLSQKLFLEVNISRFCINCFMFFVGIFDLK